MKMTKKGKTRCARITAGSRLLLWLLGMTLLMGGCSLDGLLGTDKLPPDIIDPAITQTPEGARAAYNGMLVDFRNAFGGYEVSGGPQSGFVVITGLLTDELESGQPSGNPVDRRYSQEGEAVDVVTHAYANIQRVRGQARQTIGLLTRYAPGSEPLIGHAYALQAYAEIFLADLFCSGIPLSTLDFDGDFTYQAGSTIEQVYIHAVALFDTALTLVGDSIRFTNLARVGRARALLALGRFSDAAEAVADVPDDYRYSVNYSMEAGARSFLLVGPAGLGWSVTVADHEGGNGLDYISSGDPRVQTTSTWGTNRRGQMIHHPSKYPTDGSASIVMASGVEARLVEAEAALHAGDITTWLDKLNHLRRTAWPAIQPAVAGPLPDLTDPGNTSGRVDLLFRERAFWLFLTGQRQGDLRRLIRHYGRHESQIYPVGPYNLPSIGGLIYGSAVDLAIPETERTSNPYFTGCASRGD